MNKPDNHKELGAILENLVSYVERGEQNGRPIHFIGEYKKQLDQYYADFYRNKILEMVRGAIGGWYKYPPKEFEGDTNYEIAKAINAERTRIRRAIDTITTQFNSKGDSDE